MSRCVDCAGCSASDNDPASKEHGFCGNSVYEGVFTIMLCISLGLPISAVVNIYKAERFKGRLRTGGTQVEAVCVSKQSLDRNHRKERGGHHTTTTYTITLAYAADAESQSTCTKEFTVLSADYDLAQENVTRHSVTYLEDDPLTAAMTSSTTIAKGVSARCLIACWLLFACVVQGAVLYFYSLLCWEPLWAYPLAVVLTSGSVRSRLTTKRVSGSVSPTAPPTDGTATSLPIVAAPMVAVPTVLAAPAAPVDNLTAKIADLAALHFQGALSDAEFGAAKARVVAEKYKV